MNRPEVILAQVRQLEDAEDLHLDDVLYEKPKHKPMLIRDGKRGAHREVTTAN